MLRHEDVTKDKELMADPELLQLLKEEGAGTICVQQRQTSITAEGEEVISAAGLKTLEGGGHGCLTSYIPPVRKSAYGWGTRSLHGQEKKKKSWGGPPVRLRAVGMAV